MAHQGRYLRGTPTRRLTAMALQEGDGVPRPLLTRSANEKADGDSAPRPLITRSANEKADGDGASRGRWRTKAATYEERQREG